MNYLLVSPDLLHQVICSGVTRVGVTRGGNWRCHPIFSHHRLSILQCHPSPPNLFSPEKLTTFFAHHSHFYWFYSGVTPWRVIHPQQFFSVRVSPLWRVSPWAVRPPPVTPLVIWVNCHVKLIANSQRDKWTASCSWTTESLLERVHFYNGITAFSTDRSSKTLRLLQTICSEWSRKPVAWPSTPAYSHAF